MKPTLFLKKVLLTGAVAVTLIVAVVSFALAWSKATPARPFSFDIYANGVLYVYIESEVVENAEPLYPAIAMPGAVAEGLPIDVLRVYNKSDENPSYVSRAASITEISGLFTVFNEGYDLEEVPLPKDEEGYTLYPVISADGKITWIDNSDHSKGYLRRRKVTKWKDDETNTPEEWDMSDDQYEPLINEDTREIIWAVDNIHDVVNDITSNSALNSEYWRHKKQPREGSSACTVHITLHFKASDDPEVDDYFDTSNFVVKRMYLTKEDETIPEGTGLGEVYGNSGVPFDTISNDKMTASFEMYGKASYYMHAEVYLAQPDELLDANILGKDIYMTVNVSVEVSQF